MGKVGNAPLRPVFGTPACRCEDQLHRTGHAFPVHAPVKGTRLAGVALVPVLAFAVLGHWEGSRAVKGGRSEQQRSAYGRQDTVGVAAQSQYTVSCSIIFAYDPYVETTV